MNQAFKVRFSSLMRALERGREQEESTNARRHSRIIGK